MTRSPAADDPHADPDVQRELLRLLIAPTESICLVGLSVALGISLAISHPGNSRAVWTWFAIKALVVLPRLLHAALFRRAPDPHAPRWRSSLIAVLALDGLVWGLGGLALLPRAGELDTALFASTLVAAAAVTVLVCQADSLCNAVFTLPMLGLSAIGLLMRGDLLGGYGGGGLIVFVALMLLEGRRAERRIVELVSLRFKTDHIAQELSGALDQARRDSAFKSQFLANMSHEMRTPLHGILGLTRLMRERSDDDARQQLTLVERSGEHLLAVVNDVLDLSKIEAGHLRMHDRPFDLAKEIEDLAALSRTGAAQKGLRLELELALPRPCWVEGDAARVRQVLHNLLGNAVKFTEHGGVRLHAFHDAAAGRAVLSVHDTGIGINTDDLARIFDAFHQVDATFGRRHAGTGLGLTISRELARAMDGDITCTSQPGAGSAFVFTARLPVAAEAVAAPSPQQAEPAALHPAAPTPTLTPSAPPALVAQPAVRVLLAEDNPVNAIVADATLRRLGLEVETVEDGQAAAARMRETPRPSLVLMDCQMPVMDGFEATRRIREHEARSGWPRVPIVALTANALQGDREKCLAAGMDDHLAKPFREDELAQVLRPFLAQPARARRA